MKKNELFEAWKLNEWFYSFWLFVCLVCIVNKPITPILKRSAQNLLPHILQANDEIYHDLQFTAPESFQKITLKMLIHRDVWFYVSNTSTCTPWKGLFWLHQLKYHGQVNLGNNKKHPKSHGKRLWDVKMWKSLPEARSSKDKKYGENSGKPGSYLALKSLKFIGYHLWSNLSGNFFSVGRKSGMKKLQALKNCKKWWDGVSIRVSNGILWFRHFSISLWMDIQWMSVGQKQVRDPCPVDHSMILSQQESLGGAIQRAYGVYY